MNEIQMLLFTELMQQYGSQFVNYKLDQWNLGGTSAVVVTLQSGAAVQIWTDGQVDWTVGGVMHREDGPASSYLNGDCRWYLNGKLHRVGGPAIDCAMDKLWYIHGEIQLDKMWEPGMDVNDV
jgi:hypothetical protein